MNFNLNKFNQQYDEIMKQTYGEKVLKYVYLTCGFIGYITGYVSAITLTIPMFVIATFIQALKNSNKT